MTDGYACIHHACIDGRSVTLKELFVVVNELVPAIRITFTADNSSYETRHYHMCCRTDIARISESLLILSYI
jgi:hypothetical protein